MVNRKDFRPSTDSSSTISDKDREMIRNNQPDNTFIKTKSFFGTGYKVTDKNGKTIIAGSSSDDYVDAVEKASIKANREHREVTYKDVEKEAPKRYKQKDSGRY